MSSPALSPASASPAVLTPCPDPAVLMPPSPGSPSPHQPPAQVSALASLAPAPLLSSASSAASATARASSVRSFGNLSTPAASAVPTALLRPQHPQLQQHHHHQEQTRRPRCYPPRRSHTLRHQPRHSAPGDSAGRHPATRHVGNSAHGSSASALVRHLHSALGTSALGKSETRHVGNSAHGNSASALGTRSRSRRSCCRRRCGSAAQPPGRLLGLFSSRHTGCVASLSLSAGNLIATAARHRPASISNSAVHHHAGTPARLQHQQAR